MRERGPWEEPLLWIFIGVCAISGVAYALRWGSPPWGQLGGATAVGSALWSFHHPRPSGPAKASRKKVAAFVAIMVVLGVITFYTRPFLDENKPLDWAIAGVIYGGLALYVAGLTATSRLRARVARQEELLAVESDPGIMTRRL